MICLGSGVLLVQEETHELWVQRYYVIFEVLFSSVFFPVQEYGEARELLESAWTPSFPLQYRILHQLVLQFFSCHVYDWHLLLSQVPIFPIAEALHPLLFVFFVLPRFIEGNLL